MELHRHFSVDDANALLPRVRRAFERARPLHQRMVEVASEMRARGYQPAASPGGFVPGEVSAWQHELEELGQQFDQLLRPLVELGIEIKASDGLVDFRSRYHGRTVYLCWRWDEEAIGWFHDLDDGFGGRRKIENSKAFEGDMLN